MSPSFETVAAALFHSLIDGPLLLGTLPEASVFPRHTLCSPERGKSLDFDQKLGHIYEDALGCLLEATPHYDLLDQNLQLEEPGGRTVGELDYMLEDCVSGEMIHLELATKFYLAVVTEHGLRLPGPDPRDNYFSKLERMREHQLVLPQKYGELLPSDWQSRTVITRQLVYGCIFDHVHSVTAACPEFLQPDARRGQWLHVSDCGNYFEDDAQLETIPKPLWPVPLERLEGIDLEPWVFDPEIDHCIMVRMKGGEIPYFITPDGYPDS